MKVRIKFAKTGHMKFVGHLDTMRYFQKAIRRAELQVAFSGGLVLVQPVLVSTLIWN